MSSSTFGNILEQVVREIPGARGAIFVDWEGEAVDAFTHADEEEIKLFGAHWSIVFFQTKTVFEKLGMQSPDELVLSFNDHRVIVRRVTDEYLAIIAMDPQAHLGRARALLRHAGSKLQQEM